MGWAWFVPTFHMPQPPPSSSNSNTDTPIVKLHLTRKELDFPLGVGSKIIDVEISIQWLTPTDSVLEEQPAAATPEVEARVLGLEGERGNDRGVAATVQAMTAGTVEDAVRTAQAVRN